MHSRRIRLQKSQEEARNWQPPDRAVALGYDPEHDLAPRVLAAGSGELAEKILEAARKNNIPIREDPLLATALAQVAVDEVIPPELYTLVAEVLAFVYRLKG